MFGGIDFITLFICGFFGVLGQAIRVFIGFYKIVIEKKNLKDEFYLLKFMISLVLGGLCGMLLWLFFLPNEPLNKVSISLLISAGYAGADFIEGAFKKKLENIK